MRHPAYSGRERRSGSTEDGSVAHWMEKLDMAPTGVRGLLLGARHLLDVGALRHRVRRDELNRAQLPAQAPPAATRPLPSTRLPRAGLLFLSSIFYGQALPRRLCGADAYSRLPHPHTWLAKCEGGGGAVTYVLHSTPSAASRRPESWVC